MAPFAPFAAFARHPAFSFPKQYGADVAIRAVAFSVPQFSKGSLATNKMWCAASYVSGTVAMVCKMRLAILYGSPCEFGRRSSKYPL